MPGTDRRSSTSSEDANAPPSATRQLSQDGTEIIPTRMSKVTAPKPASNPLQFIKVGPCDLYKAAQEQIKKVEEIKKVEKVKDDSEDWQSNLDNWKCSRRKRQEHIIERVVEVKKLEIEEHERNRRRSKTFNEMMEERNSKGRKMSILAYPDDDSNDLSDLGISNNKSSNDDEVRNNGMNGNGHNGGYDDSSTPATTSSPEPEEYTYERAIQGYMSFAETKIKKNANEKCNGTRVSPPKKETGSKIGEKLSELEQIRLRSKSTNDLNGENKQLPKVDINKRRSLFENSEQNEIKVEKVAKEIPQTKSIKERLENLEKREEVIMKTAKVEEVSLSATIKDRLTSLEKQKNETKRLSNGDVSTQVSIKERLNSLENKEMEINNKKSIPDELVEAQISIKERVSNFEENEIVNNNINDNNNVNNFNNNCSESEINYNGSLDDKANDNERVQTGDGLISQKEINDVSDEVKDGGGGKETVEGEEESDECDEVPDLLSPSTAEISSFGHGKKKTRTRKLTPILTGPKVSVSSKTVCELQIIEEGEKLGNVEESVKDDMMRLNIDGQEKFQDMDEEEVEGNVYTDENIDEVLGKDDDEKDENDEGVTRFDELVEETPVQEIEKEIEKEVEKPRPLPPYENVIITDSGVANNVEIVSFPLAPVSTIQPPKEKPPPPPLELSDEESTTPELPPKPSVRRLDSTKRIKKEIRKKRSDFLGIEGANDDSYLEPEIYVAPPPDMITFLQEERRLEQQLYRQSICSESDSNHETAESRDSGVELDRGHVDDICWSKPDALSEPHSRQNSETFGNTSITSEEDEILKKEREIIEVLEKEEQWRYGNKNSNCTEQNDIGEKLAVKLRQLEQEKMQLEWERAEEENRRQAEETARREDEERLKAKEQQLREQETCACNSNPDATSPQEALRSERERLQKEQEHLERCRQSLIKQQQGSNEQININNKNNNPHWDTPSTRHSLQEVPVGVPMQDVPRHSMQDVSQQYTNQQMTSSYRYSLPDLQQRSTRPPPPIPPAKPQRPLTQEQWERETNIRNSRIPSADNIPQQVDSVKLRHGSSVPAHINHGGQQMSRSTLHALSAAPRSRIISNENWMQPKRKPDAPKSSYNYQHWLIQEAEHRRIIEQQQRVSQQLQSRRSLPAAYHSSQPSNNYPVSPPSHHTVGLPISPQVHQNQKWVSPPRTDKPLPDAVIQTLTQRVQNKNSPRRKLENANPLQSKMSPVSHDNHAQINHSEDSQQRMLSVSGKKKCSHCNEELGRGAAMIIESLRLFYHINCFKCCVCHVQLGDGLMGTDVRVRNNKLHCHNCYSSDDGVKFSCV